MSENRNRGILDYSRYDAMETEELEEILRLDSEAPPEQESDTEAILYVMEVLANRRRNTTNTGKTAPQAWESFQQHYLSEEEGCLKHTSEVKKPVRTGRTWLHRSLAAAAVIALLVCIPLTARAFSWQELWNAVAKWAKETFSFVSGEDTQVCEPETEDTLQYDSLQQLLSEARGEEDLVPAWIPDRYQLEEIVINEDPIRSTYFASYLNGEETLKIFVQFYLTTDSENIEVEKEPLEIYEVSGVQYYIVANDEQLRAVWTKDSYECYISGDLTIEEIKKMIDSIGKG